MLLGFVSKQMILELGPGSWQVKTSPEGGPFWGNFGLVYDLAWTTRLQSFKVY